MSSRSSEASGRRRSKEKKETATTLQKTAAALQKSAAVLKKTAAPAQKTAAALKKTAAPVQKTAAEQQVAAAEQQVATAEEQEAAAAVGGCLEDLSEAVVAAMSLDEKEMHALLSARGENSRTAAGVEQQKNSKRNTTRAAPMGSCCISPL